FSILYFYFFFQAEDGIRDFHVTGVQTCALPISYEKPISPKKSVSLRNNDFKACDVDHPEWEIFTIIGRRWDFNGSWFTGRLGRRSEERRVGKECRSRWATDGEKNKEKEA